MNYKEKLLDLIFNADDAALMSWIQSQPLIDQPDIFRSLKEIMEQTLKDEGKSADIVAREMDEYDKVIEKYQDLILNEKLAENQYIMAVEDQKKHEKQMHKGIDEKIDGIRRYVIDCIVTNAQNAKQMRKVAKEMILRPR